jgi:replicative superfamily II helicase
MFDLLNRMRIIAVSAVLPNVFDIGEWLGCRPEVSAFQCETLTFE